MINRIAKGLQHIREQNPLIHQMTNYVSMNDCANVTLAIGAAPVMAQDIHEAPEMAKKANALVLNIGTFQSQNEAAFFAAGKCAKAYGHPVILDPVGAGATAYRTRLAKALFDEVRPDIIRCNRTEFAVIGGKCTQARGVDAMEHEQEDFSWGVEFCRRYSCVVAVTGKRDLIFSADGICQIENGDPLLAKVTGTGCMTSSITAAFSAVADPFTAAVAGPLLMGIAGQIAKERLQPNEGTGSYHTYILDAVHLMNGSLLMRYARMQYEEVFTCN